MLHRAIQDLHDDDIVATDGLLGTVDDVYFDDRRWAVRYLLLNTGDGLPGPRVLVAAASVRREQITRDAIPVALTRDEVRRGPGMEGENLRSGWEMVGYSVAARDGTIGRVEDFLIDDQDWSIVDLVVDTRDWLSGKQVLVSPDAVDSIDRNRRVVQIRLAREEIKRSPRIQ
jgi:uncharacterized protein YrrD